MLNFNKEHSVADLSSIKPKMNKAKNTGKTLLAGIALSSMLLLSGCGNYDMFDTKYTFNKAIIFGENCATIIEIESWRDYEDGEQIQLETKDGAYILTSSFDTKLIDDRNSAINAEDVVKAIKGNDVQITYLNDIADKKLKK